jgi:predicted nucleotidyltransferase
MESKKLFFLYFVSLIMAVTQQHIDKAIELAKEFGATKILLFGSALTDPENADDLDIGVAGIRGLEFFEYGGILESKINMPIDLVDLSINDGFVKHIEETGKYVYVSA